MTGLKIVETLPEGMDALWVTLDDELTRLIHLKTLRSDSRFSSLQFPRLALQARITPDGQFVRWPGGEVMTVEMVQKASPGNHLCDLLALVPSKNRYRPVLPLLWGADPVLHAYLDVRPEMSLRTNLGLKEQEWQRMIQKTAGVPRELVIARVSDLYLLLSGLFPSGSLPMLVRQTWPIIKRRSGISSVETIAECITAGRYDLIEYPLARLLVGQSSEMEDVWRVLESNGETPECPAATGINAGRQAGR